MPCRTLWSIVCLQTLTLICQIGECNTIAVSSGHYKLAEIFEFGMFQLLRAILPWFITIVISESVNQLANQSPTLKFVLKFPKCASLVVIALQVSFDLV